MNSDISRSVYEKTIQCQLVLKIFKHRKSSGSTNVTVRPDTFSLIFTVHVTLAPLLLRNRKFLTTATVTVVCTVEW